MTSKEAGRLQKIWLLQYDDKLCSHSRVVDSLITNDNQNSESLVCRECGAVFPDPLTRLG